MPDPTALPGSLCNVLNSHADRGSHSFKPQVGQGKLKFELLLTGRVNVPATSLICSPAMDHLVRKSPDLVTELCGQGRLVSLIQGFRTHSALFEHLRDRQSLALEVQVAGKTENTAKFLDSCGISRRTIPRRRIDDNKNLISRAFLNGLESRLPPRLHESIRRAVEEQLNKSLVLDGSFWLNVRRTLGGDLRDWRHLFEHANTLVFDLAYWMEAKAALTGQPYGRSLPVLLDVLRPYVPQCPRLLAPPAADQQAVLELDIHETTLASMQPSAFLELLHDTEGARSRMLESLREPEHLNQTKALVDDLLRAVGKKVKVVSRYQKLVAQKQRLTTTLRWTTTGRTVFVALLIMAIPMRKVLQPGDSGPDDVILGNLIRLFVLGAGERGHVHVHDKLKRQLERTDAKLEGARPVTLHLPT